MSINQSVQEEPRQVVLKRAMTSNEPIGAAAPTIYTEKKDGVRPEYDIRTDTMEIAREAMNALSKSKIAKREMAFKKEEKPAEPSTGTSEPK